VNKLVAKITGIQEASSPTTIEGFIAIMPDGRIFSGNNQHGVCVMRDANYLKRVSAVDAAIVPVTLTVHADPSIAPNVLGSTLGA
jgi:hypothetical protein